MKRLTKSNPLWIDDEFWTAAEEPDDELITDVYLKLKEYEDLEEQGLCIELPCKIGDAVYHKTRFSDTIAEAEITQIVINRFGFTFKAEKGSNTYFSFNDDEIGTRIFFSREAAEKALQESHQ